METKGWVGFIATFAILCSVFTIGFCEEDVKCIERSAGIEGRSILCVCNATHCDTITREVPPPQSYVMYTSTNAGKRFEKSFGPITPSSRAALGRFYAQFKTSDDDQIDYNVPKNFANLEIFENDLPIDVADVDIDLEAVLTKYRNLYKKDNKKASLGNSTLTRNIQRRSVVLTIDSNAKRQVIEGFGGSVTDAAGINWRMLSEQAQQQFIDSYFGPKGLEYNMIRVPIAGSDFSDHPYTYNEFPWNDHALSNFSLTKEDHDYKLPMIKKAREAATDEVKITASAWSPPIWMKTNQQITGFGQLKPEFFQPYADYHLRFLEEYYKEGVDIWALTTTNEPLNGIVPLARFNSLGFAPWQLGKYVAENLGPTIRNSQFNKTLILGVDDQRYMLPIYLRGMRLEDPKSMEYLDGIAIHYYGNFVPAILLSVIQRLVPGKILLSTEACEGAMPWDAMRVEIGSWERARKYVTSIMQDLNNYVVGWIDWNLCLSPTGGPNWANNFVDSPILVFANNDEFVKQPMYYAMGHFSKFIPRGSHVVSISRTGDNSVESLAVVKPDNNIVIVIQNRETTSVITKVVISPTQSIEFIMEPQSLKTIEFSP